MISNNESEDQFTLWSGHYLTFALSVNFIIDPRKRVYDFTYKLADSWITYDVPPENSSAIFICYGRDPNFEMCGDGLDICESRAV